VVFVLKRRNTKTLRSASSKGRNAANRKLHRIELETLRDRAARAELLSKLEAEREELKLIREDIANSTYSISQAMARNFTLLWTEMSNGRAHWSCFCRRSTMIHGTH
jgi:hypothetical protein